MFRASLFALYFATVSAVDVESTKHMEANIDTMNNAGSAGFDVIIICTSTTSQAQYWQDRLDATKGVTSPSDAIIIGVDEDWNGKAGNGMGTLYAFVKASQVPTD